MELWVIAAHLAGDGPPAMDGAPVVGSTGGLDLADAEEVMTPEEWQRRSRALIQQRIADAAVASPPTEAGVSTIPGGDVHG